MLAIYEIENMRLFFLMLVLANAVFYAYGYVAQQQGTAYSQSALLQINPEKIQITGASSAAVPGTGKPVPLSAAPGTAPAPCLEWGYLAGPDVVARADAAIARLDLPQTLVQRVVADVGGYWVYIPPRKNKADADRKIAELKTLGDPSFMRMINLKIVAAEIMRTLIGSTGLVMVAPITALLGGLIIAGALKKKPS